MVDEVGGVIAEPAHWVGQVLGVTEGKGVELGERGEVNQVLCVYVCVCVCVM